MDVQDVNINLQPASPQGIDPIIAETFGSQEGDFTADQGGDQQQNKPQQFQEEQGAPSLDNSVIANHPYYKGLQSKYDSTAAENGKLVKLWDQVVQDKDFRRAFIAKLEPDLFKPTDPQVFVREELEKEYGKDFEKKYEDGSTFQRMQMDNRYKTLMAKAEAQVNAPPEFEKLIAERQSVQEAEAKKIQMELLAIQTENGWDAMGTGGFTAWAQKISLRDLAYIYSRGVQKKNSTKQMTSILNMPSGGPTKGNDFMKGLNDTFGSPETGFAPELFRM